MHNTISIVLILLAGSVICQAQTRRRTPVFTITSVKAMLFYDNTGTFSEDVADDVSDSFTVPSILWNTPIEGASRKGASTSVLVTVEVSGESVRSLNRVIELTVRYKPFERAKEVVQRRSQLIRMREDGKYVVGFWIYDAGCSPVQLTARIPGQSNRSIVKKIIRFGCGE